MADAVVTAEHLAARLRRSFDWLSPHLPLDAEALARLDAAQPEFLDAFLLRFENLTNHLQESVFRGIVVEVEERDPTRMSRRDVVELMDRLRYVPSADAFREAGKVRNIPSHVYPDEPAVSAAILHRAAASVPILLDTVAMLPRGT
ncbi:hypothetical protein ACE7GA_10600 [Roseomonas sp. CCTCC AB2023176]|uniref:hypothetical protein n=1 Tax=Roseomonas sp. CCTCC AB2023176 TaxID=3342640 RepID=UPI0035DC89B6